MKQIIHENNLTVMGTVARYVRVLPGLSFDLFAANPTS
jgi:hypothetical protein